MSNTEIRANRCWHGGEPGFYVVNPETDIAVAGPFVSEPSAVRIAQERNSTPPLALDPLRVYEVVR